MSTLSWQWRVATASIWQRPAQYAGYFFVFLLLFTSLFAFNGFHSRLVGAQNLSYAEILGGDLKIDGGYRPFEADELTFFKSQGEISLTRSFRSLLRFDEENAPITRLANVRVLDENYPLIGTVSMKGSSGNRSSFHQNIKSAQDKLFILLSPDLTRYLGAKKGDVIVLADTEFTFRGVVDATPDVQSTGRDLLPYAYISSDALSILNQNAPNILYRNVVSVKLPETRDVAHFADNIKTGFHDKGWQITTSEEYSATQTGYLTLIKRVSGFINVLVLFGFGVSFFAMFKNHFIEDRGTRAQLSSMGATAPQNAVVYLLRLIALLLVSLAIIGLMSIIFATLVNAFWPESFDRIFHSSAWFLARLGETFWNVCVVTLFLGVFAYAQSIRFSHVPTLIMLLVSVALMAFFLWPRYALNSSMIESLLAFSVLIALYWSALKIFKKILRNRFTPKTMRGFAVLDYAGKYSSQENFGTVVFVNLMVISVFSIIYFAIDNSVKALDELEAPSHFVADLQPDQLDMFNQSLNTYGVRNVKTYPILRARVTDVKGQVVRSADGWLFRGDRVFGIDEENVHNLEKRADNHFEVAISKRIADTAELKIDDELTISVLGQPVQLTVKIIHSLELNARNLEFSFTLPREAKNTLPHIYLGSANFTDSQDDAIREILSRFPNVILVSSQGTINRIDAWVSQMLGYLGGLVVYILIAMSAALISLGVMIMRKDRYDLLIFNMIGMKARDKYQTLFVKILINATLATIASFVLGVLFSRYALGGILDLQVRVNFGQIALIVFLFGIFCAAIPTLLLLFSRENPRKVEEYAQDFEHVTLDF